MQPLAVEKGCIRNEWVNWENMISSTFPDERYTVKLAKIESGSLNPAHHPVRFETPTCHFDYNVFTQQNTLPNEIPPGENIKHRWILTDGVNYIVILHVPVFIRG